jgi:hypothetical protein
MNGVSLRILINDILYLLNSKLNNLNLNNLIKSNCFNLFKINFNSNEILNNIEY